jgi:NADPH:quinone reductase-like Zn-dependent oxidoreductase
MTEYLCRLSGGDGPPLYIGVSDDRTRRLRQHWPLDKDGRLRLRAHQTTPVQQAAEAHRQLESGNVHERIILTVN